MLILHRGKRDTEGREARAPSRSCRRTTCSCRTAAPLSISKSKRPRNDSRFEFEKIRCQPIGKFDQHVPNLSPRAFSKTSVSRLGPRLFFLFESKLDQHHLNAEPQRDYDPHQGLLYHDAQVAQLLPPQGLPRGGGSTPPLNSRCL